DKWIIFIISWELITITTSIFLCWRGKSLASQYFILQFAGSSILIFAFLLAINQGYNSIMPVEDFWLQNLLILGVAMKSAIIGFHFWMVPIYTKADTPFKVISSAFVAKFGFIFLLKVITEGNNLLFYAGIVMVFYGGFKAVIAKNYNHILAYSSISQLGFIAIGIGAGTLYGYLGSVFHIIAHGLAKSALFIITGHMFKNSPASSILDYKESWTKQPVRILAMIMSFASMIGIPLLAGFNSKYLLKYAFQNQLSFTILMHAATFLTALYSLRFLYWLVFKDFFKDFRGNKFFSDGENFNKGKLHYFILILIIGLLFIPGLQAEFLKRILFGIDFNYNILSSFLELLLIITLSLFILKRSNYYKREGGEDLSLDDLFQLIYKKLYNIGRNSYRWVYKEFQYQLLWIPFFLIIAYLWAFLAI
ncbi:MAG: proton-conducting transporter membrane subunit, partial [bacterium]